ncbi:MAG TPA: hypothetical protein DIS94_06630 [Bacteroidetes bacterium]|nr:hypothetical protein [Bacteroidota bacterium]
MKQTIIKILFLLLAVIFSGNELISSGKETSVTVTEKFRLGNENLHSIYFSEIQNKKSAIVTNNSGINSEGEHIVDMLKNIRGSFPIKIFSPEHGFRGDDNDTDHLDEVTGIPVITLYGNKKKPTKSELEDVEVIIYDIQDVGARFYTYINTMYYCMEAAIENNKKLVICDRPIIPNPNYIDGFMLDNDVKSFVGLLDIPISYGLTIGELANYINQTEFNGKCDLFISKMSGYSRNMDYNNLGIVWKNPSPSMLYPSTAVTYSGTCLLEGSNFAEGRGTDKPFEYVGAPYCDGDLLKSEMDKFGFEGVKFESIEFTPTSITSPSNPPKFVGKKCEGVYIKITDKSKAEPVKIGIALLVTLNKNFPQFKIRNDKFLDKLSGTKKLRTMIENGTDYNTIISSYETPLKKYKDTIASFYLY